MLPPTLAVADRPTDSKLPGNPEKSNQINGMYLDGFDSTEARPTCALKLYPNSAAKFQLILTI
jgi:hypothetical protein